jgi:hypothetical protein
MAIILAKRFVAAPHDPRPQRTRRREQAVVAVTAVN